MLKRLAFYIDGEFINPAPGRARLPVVDPATEEEVALIPLGQAAEVEAAVAAARRAFPSFAATSPKERHAMLQAVKTTYAARAEEMAEMVRLEMGAPIDLARQQQVPAGTEHLDGFMAAMDGFPWEVDYAPGERHIHTPIGVVGMITPWNWPLNQILLKVGAALAAGCTMVLKPSEIAPLSGHLFTEIMHEAGLPKGVFNMVHGDGPGVGHMLSAHPGVDMISFTGSTRAGRAITAASVSNLKRVSLELGGKGANLIFADADEKAVRRGVRQVMNNSGQSCNAPTRMLVEQSRYAAAVEEAAAAAEATGTGPTDQPGNHIGPVVSAVQYDKIQDLIRSGIDEGARLVAGGPDRPEGTNRGYYVRPTVFADVTPDMRIWREEIFGPVLSITPFADEAEALRLADDTEYGLTNYVQTGDPERAKRVARQLSSGMVQVNGKSFALGSPFGGFRQSGNGREGGRHGIMDMMEVKAVSDWQ